MLIGFSMVEINVQLLLHVPDELAVRFKAAIPPGQRSRFIVGLLEKALPETDDSLYRLALEVEQNERLHEDMAAWDATVTDGWEDEH